LNIRHLKYFVATAETGQVSRAAAALNISQSAVTAAIKDLEGTIGTVLFRRSGSGMELTELGREFLRHAREVLAKLEDALRISHANADEGGVVRVATSYTVMGYFLPYHLDRLRRIHPRLEVQVSELNREAVEEGVVKGRFDLGLAITSNVENPVLVRETLLRSLRRLWLPTGHVLAQRRTVSFAEIATEPYIMLTVDEAAHTAMRYWNASGFVPDVRVRTSSIEAVRSMVANGAGVTILSDMVYRPWSLEGRRIVTIPTDPAAPSMDIGLVWAQDREQTLQAHLLARYFREAYAAHSGP
jgi:DNA-binding transcriptional LysR family regulator